MDNGYYAVDRSDEYLAHYGIRGMKWGVRKAIESGNARRLGRQFRRAERKLEKLERQANNGAKYARRASRLGAGAALSGGLAIAGTEGVAKGMRAGGTAMANLGRVAGNAALRIPGNGKIKKAAIQASRGIREGGKAVAGTSGAIDAWGKSQNLIGVGRDAGKGVANLAKRVGLNDVGDRINTAVVKGTNAAHRSGVTNNMIARAGAGALGAGLAAGALYNQHRAKTTDKKARQAAAFRKEMQKSFAGTQYANQIGQSRKKKRR